MQGKRRLITVAAVVVAFVLLGATFLRISAQENQERTVHSNGQGTLKIGDEHFKITSVVVKLMDDHQAELILVSEITIFLPATWSNHGESLQEFDLEITRGGLEGSGRVILSKDGKSVTQVNLKGISRTTKRPVEVNFEGK
jgi:hypothetical protein